MDKIPDLKEDPTTEEMEERERQDNIPESLKRGMQQSASDNLPTGWTDRDLE